MKPIEQNKNKLRIVGIILVVLSFVFYGLIVLLPFLPYSVSTKAVFTSCLVVLGEGSFWVGAIILGREFANKFRRYLNPLRWFKNKCRHNNNNN